MNTHAACPSNPCYRLDQLSDSDLLASTRSLVGRSNQLLAALLAHLAEVEARGIHRARACASLYTYCISRDLLAHAVPNRSIEQVHLRALRTLVAELKKRKLGATDAPRRPRPENKTQSTPARAQRGRYVTAAVRRAVWSRDGGRCTFVDPCGQRCRETSCLEPEKSPHLRRRGQATR